ncbi:MAG: DUF4834 family protein [Bacteroidaceae bacterium]|nr:DUF4834 family protein [Bacteroidaceae bacterium]MDO4201999.1 DUF4834 family protein [Bacteroidales bacterium]
MDVLITILLFIVIPALVLIIIGLYLLSRLVGGLGNLRAIYRLFSGKGVNNTQRSSAKSSSSGKSSRTYNNKNQTRTKNAQTDDKVFGHNEGTYVEFEEVND